MKQKFSLVAMAMLICTSMFAQWTKPTAPASVPMQPDSELYLYNPAADGFYLGANDWNTRASIDGTKGYKVFIEKYELDDISYYLSSFVESKDKKMYTFLDGVESIWVDREKTPMMTNFSPLKSRTTEHTTSVCRQQTVLSLPTTTPTLTSESYQRRKTHVYTYAIPQATSLPIMPPSYGKTNGISLHLTNIKAT